MYVPKRSPRQQYRLKQQAQIEASPLMSVQFPRLKALQANLEFFGSGGTTRNGQLKCKLNVAHAKAALWFACPGVECLEGDFDLSQALSQAVDGQQKTVVGELCCRGTRKHGSHDPEACGTLLRYRLSLIYG